MDGPEAALLVLLMFAGCLGLWVGVPVAWLWIGSQVEASSTLGTAMAVTLAGAIVSIVAGAALLSRLNRRHGELQLRRGRSPGPSSPLETMLVASGTVAVVGFAIWFFLFAGASPAPLNISY